MSVGLLALLDDVLALVKVSAASLDDISTQVAKATSKVSGIVIDDAAVTPKYVIGLDPKRELAIIYRIAKRSLVNKIVFLGPLALLLGFFAPWLIQPLLMVGGAYLCLEGYEKIHSIFASSHTKEHIVIENLKVITPDELEKIRVKNAVRTDFILSAEIMAITFATVSDKSFLTQAVILFTVAIVITIAVYGFVGLIVKMDDIGLNLAREQRRLFIQKIGHGIVKFMPHFLIVLGYIGTAAMLWVGAEIIIHGIPFLHHLLEKLNNNSIVQIPVVVWSLKVVFCAVFGIIVGAMIDRIVFYAKKLYGVFKEKLHV